MFHVLLIIAVGPYHLWYSLPLVAVVSLVYAATRHELMMPILLHAVRFAAWIVGFMLVVMVILYLLS